MPEIRNLCVLFIIILIVVFVESRDVHSCTIFQRDEPGICVPQSQCWTVKTLLNLSPQPQPQSVVDYVQNSRCENIHHVCCNPKNVAIGEPTQGIERSKLEEKAGMAMLQQQADCGVTDADRGATLEEVNLYEFPWMALLVYFEGVARTIDCGGSLIHERYVLTAAHCIRVPGKKLKSVRLGEHNTESTEDCVTLGLPKRTECAPPVQEIDVDKAIYHQKYNASRFSDDIGLIRLVSNAVIAKNVRPICLPITEQSQNNPLSYMLIAGWGRQGNEHQTTIPKKAAVPMKSLKDCQKTFNSRNIKLTEKQLCAGTENEYDACRGDTGGPLFYNAPYKLGARYIQYGVISPRDRSCVSNIPNIYVRVQAYLPWIASNLNSN